MKPYSWRHAILHADLQSTTKLVLLALSCHINDAGESCFPSTRRQAEETGLSERAVITHLKIAADAGWLKVAQHGFGGQKWRRHEYLPLIPDSIEPLNEVRQLNEKALNDVQHEGTEHDSAASPKGTERRSAASEKGTEPDDKKVLNDVQSSSPVEKSKKKEKREEAPALPAGLSDDSWSEFKSHRKKMRAPMTAEAERRALAKLTKLEADGHDPEKIVDRAIIQGWKGLFENEDTLKKPPPMRRGDSYASSRGSGAPRSAVDRVKAANERRRLERERTFEGEFHALG